MDGSNWPVELDPRIRLLFLAFLMATRLEGNHFLDNKALILGIKNIWLPFTPVSTFCLVAVIWVVSLVAGICLSVDSHQPLSCVLEAAFRCSMHSAGEPEPYPFGSCAVPWKSQGGAGGPKYEFGVI